MLVTKIEVYDIPDSLILSEQRLKAVRIASRLMSNKYEDWDKVGFEPTDAQKDEFQLLIEANLGCTRAIAYEIVENLVTSDYLISTNIMNGF